MTQLKVPENPLFECPECGYQDFMGNTEVCPVCDPDGHEKQDVCFFLDGSRGLCRQDGLVCGHTEDKSWDKCEKLEGFNPARGKKK